MTVAVSRIAALQFTIAVVNQDPRKSKYSDTLHRFCKKEHDWGWKKFMELSKVGAERVLLLGLLVLVLGWCRDMLLCVLLVLALSWVQTMRCWWWCC